jgi:hypothetical protein
MRVMTRSKDRLYSPNGWKQSFMARIAEHIPARHWRMARLVSAQGESLADAGGERRQREHALDQLPLERPHNK